MTDLHHPASQPPPAYDYGYPPISPPPIRAPRPSRGPWVVSAVAALIAVGSVAFGVHAQSTAPRGPATGAPAQVSSPADDSPGAARERVCGVLERGYPAVVDAIHQTNEFLTAPWSDPAAVRAANALVRETTQLAAELEQALSSETPRELKTAMSEYITALRALGASYRDHASDEQINGVGALYSHSRHGALQACGMEDK